MHRLPRAAAPGRAIATPLSIRVRRAVCATLIAFSWPLPAIADDTPAQAAFAQLKSLVGEWRGVFPSGREHTVSYRLTAGGSTLVETWTLSPTRESMTLYALDGDRLLATHYCPQGNQPRLRFDGIDEEGRYRFEFVDGTNLQVADRSHQHRFWLAFDDADHYRRAEHYVRNVPSGESSMEDAASEDDDAVVYTRIAPDRPAQ